MTNVFIASPSDITKLQHRVLQKIEAEYTLCSQPHEVKRLSQADVVYFVISDMSMSSTAFQELVKLAFLSTEHKEWWLLFLDEVEIPEGVCELRSLPRKHFETI